MTKAKDEESCELAIQSYMTNVIYDTSNKGAGGFRILLIISTDIQSASNPFNPTEGT